MGSHKLVLVLLSLFFFKSAIGALSFNEFDCTTSCTQGSGQFNTYWSGISTFTSNSVYVRGNAASYSRGSLFYIIQMQDSICDFTDSSSYGTITSQGSTGLYELNTLQSTSYDGSNTYLIFENTLVNTYYDADATNLQGQRRFQVIFVPTCGSLSFTADPTVPAWDGYVGGVFVSVSQNLNLNGYTIDVSAKGFRGGVRRSVSNNGAHYSYVTSITSGSGSENAQKGEGSCGTPSQTFVADGLPNGDLSRGAPANAGGGGNDWNGGGGGGGGAGGAGGRGGVDLYSFVDIGGFGGRQPSFSTSSLYAYFGGGGGAGQANEPTSPHAAGLRGGGIIVIAADNVIGSGTLKVNGETPAGSYSSEFDGGGGGGGAGTVHLISRNSASSNRFGLLTIQARGGDGVQMQSSYAPGGGGGGGIILSTDSLNSANLDLTAGLCIGSLCVSSSQGNGITGQAVSNLQFTDFSVLYSCTVVNTNSVAAAGLSFINEINCQSTCTYGSGSTVNAYWPGIATTGETSVTVGGDARVYPVGTLFYIIQMQDTVCDFTATSSYGSVNSFGESGLYEINTLVNLIYDSAEDISQLFFERNLQNNYQTGATSSTAGQKRFQVIYVPNCGTITFNGDPLVPSWDGRKGGVFVTVSQNFNLNGHTISVRGDGFRGASYFVESPVQGSPNTDYVDYYGDVLHANAYKAEGICGTFNFLGGTTVGASGYPNGDLARGAPANAGGGGNKHNNGGGGGGGAGGNGARGGFFNGLNSNYVGIGGRTPSQSGNSLYAFFGGGGGAGHSDNTEFTSNGLNGGGIIVIITDNVLGAGNLDASGNSDGTTSHDTIDGGGGGGGAGTVVLVSRNSVSGNVFGNFNIFVTGGNGYYVRSDHGSGGAGGGGVVISTDNINPARVSLNGGVCLSSSCVDSSASPGFIASSVGLGTFGFTYTCASNFAVSNVPVVGSPSISRTRSQTPAISGSRSRTPTRDSPATASKSATPAISVTPAVSLTSTITPTNNRFSSSPTKTITSSVSDTPTRSITQSISKTISVTASPSRSNGSSRSPLASRTPDSSSTSTASPTRTGTPPVSVTPSNTPPVSPTRSITSTPSSSIGLGNTLSLSPTRTISDTPSVSRSHTSSPTQSKSESVSRTPTKSITQTRSPSISQTSTITSSISITATRTITPSKSALPGPPSATPVASDSPSISVSFSVSKSRSSSASITPSPSISQSESRSVGASNAASSSKSISISRTPSKSFSATASISKSRSPTNSLSHTRSQSPNPQIDASESRIPSPSPSSSSFGAITVTASPFGFISLSVTSSPSLSSSKTPSSFPSVSASNSPLPCSCNDNNVCTEDTCDPVSGECRFIPITTGFIACDDGFACTSSDQCLFGECRGVQVTCDDNNDCTLDSCDPATGNCANVPITSANSNNELEILRCNSAPVAFAQEVLVSPSRSSQPLYYVPPVQVLPSPSQAAKASPAAVGSVQAAPSEEDIQANSSSSFFFSSSLFLLVLFFALL